jgi:heme-degrading monooxygenase HmoA
MGFSVIFEVTPHASEWETYLAAAKSLRPELENIRGFVDNIRYASLTRPGTVLSLSNWADEKALIRWRTKHIHHTMQEKGRNEILEDYHLRVGEIIKDDGDENQSDRRLDETEVGLGTTITMINCKVDEDEIETGKWKPEELVAWLGLDVNSNKTKGLLLGWDVFNAVLTSGDVIGLATWKDRSTAQDFAAAVNLPEESRLRIVRVIRDYGKYDRREAPQYYPDATGKETIHV